MNPDDLTRRPALLGLGVSAAAFTLAAAPRLAEAGGKGTKAATRAPPDDAEVITLEKALSDLDSAEFKVVAGPAPASGRADGVICQPAGSSHDYVDARKAGEATVIYTDEQTGSVPLVLCLRPAGDPSAAAVEAHLRAAGARVVALTPDDPLVDAHLALGRGPDDAALRTRSGLRLRVSEVDACWHHQGGLVLALPAGTPDAERPHREAEWRSVQAMVLELLARSPSLGALTRPHEDDRLLQLAAAASVGLPIPATAVVSSRADGLAFVEEVGATLTKALAHGLPGSTRRVDPADLLDGPPRLLQAAVPRQAELRVLFLDGARLGMAVFPTDAATVDWRIGGMTHAVAVPYLPPAPLQRWLRALMTRLGLDTGSIDLVLTPDDEAVFLEVNPGGQFVNLRCGEDAAARVAEALLARAAGASPLAVSAPAPHGPAVDSPHA